MTVRVDKSLSTYRMHVGRSCRGVFKDGSSKKTSYAAKARRAIGI